MPAVLIRTTFSRIGHSVSTSRNERVASGVFAIAGALFDSFFYGYGIVIGLVALVWYGTILHWDRGALGLIVIPVQGWAYWLRASLFLGMIVLLVAGSVYIFCRLFGYFFFIPQVNPAHPELLNWIVSLTISAPLIEESVYRFALCVPLVSLIGPFRTIVISGLIFGAAHFIWGNPGPDNFVAGYLLAWSFLKSGSIVIPIILHAAGNACVGAFAITMYYYPIFVVS